ncbi:MAG: cache domain-containing protein [Gammaproteobacteria bacterium]|nr:cache domain-containing protein [Gammaproteobacteria bacterium]
MKLKKIILICVLSLLFIFVPLGIVSSNYYSLNNTLIILAKNSLSYAGKITSEKISNYLGGLLHRTKLCAALIASNTVAPGNTAVFTEFLHNLLVNAKSIEGVGYADTVGDFYLMLRTRDNKYLANYIVAAPDGAKRIESVFDEKLKLLSSTQSKVDLFYARDSMWYQQAAAKKQSSWFIFSLRYIGINSDELGILSMTPAYSSDGKFHGVFTASASFAELTNFIKHLALYDHTIVMICDDRDRVMAAYAAKIDLTSHMRMPKISDLKIPWLQTAYSLHKQNQQTIFTFSEGKHNYLATFDSIPEFKGELTWFVATVTPVSDITAVSRLFFSLSLIALIAAAIIGIIIVRLFHLQIKSRDDV